MTSIEGNNLNERRQSNDSLSRPGELVLTDAYGCIDYLLWISASAGHLTVGGRVQSRWSRIQRQRDNTAGVAELADAHG